MRRQIPPFGYSRLSGAGTLLRRFSKKKLPCAAAVSIKQRLKLRPPEGPGFTTKRQKIAACFRPSHGTVGCATNLIKIVNSSQNRMRTPKTTHNYDKPAHHQPGGYQTVLIHRNRSTIKAAMPPLPTPQTQKQRCHNGMHRILKIGDQLSRQQRKGLLLFAT